MKNSLKIKFRYLISDSPEDRGKKEGELKKNLGEALSMYLKKMI